MACRDGQSSTSSQLPVRSFRRLLYHAEPVDQGLQVPGMRIIVQRVVRKDIRSAGSCSAAPSLLLPPRQQCSPHVGGDGHGGALTFEGIFGRLPRPFLLPWCAEPGSFLLWVSQLLLCTASRSS